VEGAKRLRRSRWERGTRERVARGGARPVAGAGGLSTRIEWTRKRQIAGARLEYKRRGGHVTRCPSARAGSVRDVDTGTGRNERAGPPPVGRFVQSGRTSFFPVTALRAFTTGRTVTFFPELNEPARPAAARPESSESGRAGARAARGRRIDKRVGGSKVPRPARRSDEPAGVSNGGV